MCPKTKRYGAALASVPFLPFLSFAAFADGNASDASPANTWRKGAKPVFSRFCPRFCLPDISGVLTQTLYESVPFVRNDVFYAAVRFAQIILQEGGKRLVLP